MRSAPAGRPRTRRIRAAAPTAAVLLLVALAYASISRAPRTLFETDSAFGRVRVVERHDGLRSLYIGGGRARQTAVFPDRPMHLELAYTRVAVIGLALVPMDGRLLYVGLGGGAMPTHARHVLPLARIDVVEIDPVIVDVAQRWFGFTPGANLSVHTDDGRAFIERATPGMWDLIVLDAFSDDAIPFSLTTRQFLEAVRTRVTADGVVIANLFTRGAAHASMLATYDAVFDDVHRIAVPGRRQEIVVASAATRALDRTTLVNVARAFAGRVELGFDLAGLVEGGYESLPRSHASVLDDADRRER